MIDQLIAGGKQLFGGYDYPNNYYSPPNTRYRMRMPQPSKPLVMTLLIILLYLGILITLCLFSFADMGTEYPGYAITKQYAPAYWTGVATSLFATATVIRLIW
jgi:hypothetical protein